MNLIPTEARALVHGRDRDRCMRCGGKGADWHHRRGRSVPGEHQHCPDNGITLCRTCHAHVHANPMESQATGMIVSRYNPVPGDISVRTYLGWLVLDCEGGYEFSRDGDPF